MLTTKQKTKQELYNKIISTYNEFGQGLPTFAISSLDQKKALEDLIHEGYVKIYTQEYKHLPNDHWIFPTNKYCYMEEENSKASLECLRLFLDKPTSIKKNILMTNTDFVSYYDNWLLKNKDVLKTSFDSTELELVTNKELEELTDEEIEELNSYSFFDEAESIGYFKEKLKRLIFLYKDFIKLTNESLMIDPINKDKYEKELKSKTKYLKLAESIMDKTKDLDFVTLLKFKK